MTQFRPVIVNFRNPDGTIASKPATFYRINKKPDGYFRQSANIKPRAINVEEAPNFHPQTAVQTQGRDL